MTAFWDEMAQVCTDLLTDLGAHVSLKHQSPAFDPIDGEAAGSVDPSTTIGLVISRNSKLVQDRLVEGATDIAVIDASVEPLMSDRFVDADGDEFTIVEIDKINPAGTPVAYFLHLNI